MNTDTIALLDKHFDLAVNAPDGIKRLREMILTLAMQGKLVPQDPKDQPASELLKEIESEKKRLVKEGKIKEPKPLPPIKPEEVPYKVPESWAWVRLGDITSINGGYAFKSNQYISNGMRVIRISDFNENGFKDDKIVRYKYSDEIKDFLLNENDIVMAMTGGTVGKSYLVKKMNEQMLVNQRVATIRYCKELLPSYLYSVIQSDLTQDVINHAKNSTNDNISMADIVGFKVPLPPLAEQRRIVAKIDELMARVDELERKRDVRNEKRLAMHQAAIARLLDAGDANASRSGRDFIFAHFGELYGTKENVAELRKAILQLAVMGRLVPQDPQDQSASELLKEIEAEKKRLLQEGKIKEPKPLPLIKPEEVPYQVPEGWVWVRLGDVCQRIIDGNYGESYPTQEEFVSEGIPFFTAAAIGQNLDLLESKIKYITLRKHKELLKAQSTVGDIFLTNRGGRVGAIAVVSDDRFTECNIGPQLTSIRLLSGLSAIGFFINYLVSPVFQGILVSQNTGSAMNFLNLTKTINFPAPLPPLAEQHRIVAKVDELMALCDKLDKQIDERTAKESALLEAVAARV